MRRLRRRLLFRYADGALLLPPEAMLVMRDYAIDMAAAIFRLRWLLAARAITLPPFAFSAMFY